MTDESGSVTATADYDAFGNSINNNLTTRYQYTGREFDAFTGLYYYRARWYDSQAGRFISEDPIGFAGGDVNLYGYVLNSPLKHKDPKGLDIVVIENGPTDGNPFGHTAIGISGKGIFSYGNGAGGDGSNIINGGFSDYLSREAPRRRTGFWVIKTTPEQDRAAEEMGLQIDKESPLTFWGIFSDNCSSRSNRILDAAGINLYPGSGAAPHWLPGSSGQRAFGAGGNLNIVPKGSGVTINNGLYFGRQDFTPQDFSQFEPR